MFFHYCFVCDLCVEVLEHSVDFAPMVSCLGSDTVHTDPPIPLAPMTPPSALLTSSCRFPVGGSLDTVMPPCPSSWKRGPEKFCLVCSIVCDRHVACAELYSLGENTRKRKKKNNHFCLLGVCLIIEKYRETHVTFLVGTFSIPFSCFLEELKRKTNP